LGNLDDILETKPSCTKNELKAVLADLVEKVENLSPPGLGVRLPRRKNESYDHGVKLITHVDTRFLHCNIDLQAPGNGWRPDPVKLPCAFYLFRLNFP
jgi:hypothetical protein